MQTVTHRPQAHTSHHTYWKVAAILAAVTLLEFAAIYIPGLSSALIPLLLLLSMGKFMLVLLYFMHLKYETRMFAYFFGCGLLAAAVVIISLKLLLHAGHAGS